MQQEGRQQSKPPKNVRVSHRFAISFMAFPFISDMFRTKAHDQDQQEYGPKEHFQSAEDGMDE